MVYKCDYHIVFTPKYRFRILTGEIAANMLQDIRTICQWQDVEIDELNIQLDQVHVIVSIPPRLSVSDFIGILKGKTEIKLFKNYPNLKKKPNWGNHFWSRGYFVNTIDINEDMIRSYVKYQEEERKYEKERSDFPSY